MALSKKNTFEIGKEVRNMRTEKAMMELILSTAENDERIRAVIMNGSRTNPNVKKDIFQDYDIVYIVNEIDSFICNHHWVDHFGERMMMQMPEDKEVPPPDGTGHFVYLMQFMDGNRIDLTLIPLEKMNQLLKQDSLSVVLLDKDDIICKLPPPSDQDYHIKRPSEKEFQDICNEFWWICLNISKGLWRKELTYAKFMYEQINRNVLIRMIEWSIGIKTNFSVSAGKLGKYFEDFLDREEWNEFVATYGDAKEENIWNSLFIMCEIFRKNAIRVAEHFRFSYPYQDDQRVSAYLRHVKSLPKDAKTIY
jgi:aminoglycoside 6-adenylyltransferase